MRFWVGYIMGTISAKRTNQNQTLTNHTHTHTHKLTYLHTYIHTLTHTQVAHKHA